MEISKIRALWPEKAGFTINRKDTGDEYIFIHCHTPVAVWEKGKWHHTKECIFALYDKHAHQQFKADGVPLMHDWMHILGNMDSLMQKTGLLYNTVYTVQDSEKITAIMQDLEAEFLRADAFSKEIQKVRIAELFLRLGRQVHGEPITLTRSLVKRFTEARTEIHKNYFMPWTVEKMAELVHISPSRFYDLYKKIFWLSPKKDLQYIRIEHAKWMLLQDTLSVKEIASAVGYENEYYFIRKFKEQTGTTPGKYKKGLGV
ncbi:MAG: helix-turn-helix transcriptional regulator [Clostridia bacterium]|nr:helix-turn-helix transcriptional regulator [Clostridia bacterium]